ARFWCPTVVVVSLFFVFVLFRLFCSPFFFRAEDGIRVRNVTGVQTCALPISNVTGLPIVVEPITISVAKERHMLDTTTSYNEKPAWKNIAEETGITIEWVELAAGTAEIGRAACRERA